MASHTNTPPAPLPASPPSPQGQDKLSFFLHNHLRFNILYNRDAATDLARIVGFEVQPFSVRHEYDKPWDAKAPSLKTCNPGAMVAVSHSQAPLEVKEGGEVIFTYDVKFTVRAVAGSGSTALAGGGATKCGFSGRGSAPPPLHKLPGTPSCHPRP